MLQCVAFLCKFNKAFVVFNLAEIANFKNEWKNEHHYFDVIMQMACYLTL